jgi:hypothetical protein
MNTDSLITLAAALIPAIGGVLYTASQWGSISNKMETVQTAISAHNVTLATQQQEIQLHEVHDAVIEQNLTDIKDQLNRIEKHQR